MIVSASRRTDVPAFYARWLMERLRAGYCLVRNPFNPRQVSRVGLAPDEVDALVLWSKNPAPLLPHLPDLDRRGYRYLFFFTLNDYPAALEPRVPPAAKRVETFRRLADRLGPERVTWRYDPIVVTPATDPAFHEVTVERLARALDGATHRLVLSVVHPYRKTVRRLAGLADRGFAFDPATRDAPATRTLLERMAAMARSHGITTHACADERDLALLGIRPGRCIDPQLVRSLGGRAAETKDRGQREHCGCSPSRDIGTPDTCRHGCTYCYAVSSDALARQRYARHDPHSPFLFDAAAHAEERAT